MVVKTFRGRVADGGQDRIRLQTIKGKVGYRIVSYQIMPYTPLASSSEYVSKIYNHSTGTADGTVDFTDSNLLGAAFTTDRAVGAHADFVTSPVMVIFDREIFNQDIYITNYDGTSSNTLNYYLELEVIPLDDAGAEYTTLKDMRST